MKKIGDISLKAHQNWSEAFELENKATKEIINHIRNNSK
jgi:hypothetical protein